MAPCDCLKEITSTNPRQVLRTLQSNMECHAHCETMRLCLIDYIERIQ